MASTEQDGTVYSKSVNGGIKQQIDATYENGETSQIASSMPWVRNLQRFIESTPDLSSEALMELETKRILADIFKKKQQKSAEAGSIPCFYKKKPEGSISRMVQRLAKYHILKNQCDLLLNADDLDAMWACLKENCVTNDATGAEKMDYEEFSHIASVCTEWIGPKCERFFSPSEFMKFKKDESGRIDILPFYHYVMAAVRGDTCALTVLFLCFM